MFSNIFFVFCCFSEFFIFRIFSSESCPTFQKKSDFFVPKNPTKTQAFQNYFDQFFQTIQNMQNELNAFRLISINVSVFISFFETHVSIFSFFFFIDFQIFLLLNRLTQKSASVFAPRFEKFPDILEYDGDKSNWMIENKFSFIECMLIMIDTRLIKSKFFTRKIN